MSVYFLSYRGNNPRNQEESSNKRTRGDFSWCLGLRQNQNGRQGGPRTLRVERQRTETARDRGQTTPACPLPGFAGRHGRQPQTPPLPTHAVCRRAALQRAACWPWRGDRQGDDGHRAGIRRCRQREGPPECTEPTQAGQVALPTAARPVQQRAAPAPPPTSCRKPGGVRGGSDRPLDEAQDPQL